MIAEIVFLSLKVATLAMVLVVPASIMIGRFLSIDSPTGGFGLKVIVSALVHLPLVLPPVVTGYFLLLVFGRNGPIGSVLETIGLGLTFHWTGAALAAALMALPLVVRPIRLAFEAIDPELENMAALLGAGRARRFATIVLPLAWPGILAGFVLGFAKALGEFGATITFVSNIPGETQTLSLAIYTLLQSPSGDKAALTLISVSVALSILAVLVSEILIQTSAKRREL